MLLRRLRRGDQCVVATPARGNEIVFSWFAFQREEEAQDEGVPVRVFFGEFLRSERLDRTEATETAPYSNFFNINGHFKRQSVLEQQGGAS